MPVMANAVVVALVKSELPVSVVEAIAAERPALSAPPTLSAPDMVEEAESARLVPVALRKSKSTRWEVEEAVKPLVNCRSVVVALVLSPYCVEGVNGKICASDEEEILLLKMV